MAIDETLALATILQEAVEGLLWTSESDYPFTVCQWQGQSDAAPEMSASEIVASEAFTPEAFTPEPFTPELLLQRTEHPAETPVETIAPETFFAGVTQVQDWQGEEERAIASRYQALLATLKQHLSDLTVYRVGTIEIDLYIIGKTQAGNFVGLSTKAVET